MDWQDYQQGSITEKALRTSGEAGRKSFQVLAVGQLPTGRTTLDI